MDFNIKLGNGQVLSGFIKSPGSDLRAVIIMVHGLGEHIRRYEPLAQRFSEQKIGFTGVDLPGHGQSDGKKGHIRDYELIGDMLDILLEESRKTFPGIPQFVYGHSLGGGIVLNYLLKREPSVRGSIITSPWLKLSFEPEKYRIWLAGFINRIFPSFTMPAGLVPAHISHDTKAVSDYLKDPLVHGKISVRLFSEAMRAADFVLANAGRLKVPVLLMHGSDDKICSPEGSRLFKSFTGYADLRIWDGGYHELHHEHFKEDVFDDITRWINERLL